MIAIVGKERKVAQITTGLSAAIREFIMRSYVSPARRDSSPRFTVNAGDVHREMRLNNRVPQVCSVLQSSKFLQEHGLRIIEKSGPPSGFSTSVTITYEFIDQPSLKTAQHPLLGLRGVLRDVFRELGGGENFIRTEREAFSAGLDEKSGGR